ncbi:pancreatic secretory granule membrane major glycoprotein GP2-like [Bombina bombina]|uniref:pancreatic secretory granule membrane major glycoprotein GP2-like n=1 Tax=Bombina bombina TaxID=8345 RepID=UPI00235A6C8D|nr:pancreatic secretory granule membrane major glycoprotein GP2-like [Bombina bombina]
MKFLCIFAVIALLIETSAAATCYAGSSPPLCNTCGGSCTTENGCACSDDITTCFPGDECLAEDNTCCPSGYYWHADINCCSDELKCIPACGIDEMCTAVNSVATCKCNDSYYDNPNPSTLNPLVTCEASAMTLSIEKCFLESIGYDSSNMLVNNSVDCTFPYTVLVNNVRVIKVQAKPITGWCGNVVTTDGSKIYYTSTLYIGIQNSSLITVNPSRLNFTCSYNATMQTSLAAAFHPVVGTVNLTVNGEGSAPTTMAAYWDQSYTKPITDTEDVPVESTLYLGLFSEFVDSDNFALRVEDCFATPDGDNNNVNKAYLVRGGCNANDGINTAVEENGQSLQARIKVSAFAFRDQPLVYVTCNVRLCSKNGTCTGCNVARAAARDGLNSLQIKVNLLNNDYDISFGSQAVASWTVLLSSLLVLLCSKLF